MLDYFARYICLYVCVKSRLNYSAYTRKDKNIKMVNHEITFIVGFMGSQNPSTGYVYALFSGTAQNR